MTCRRAFLRLCLLGVGGIAIGPSWLVAAAAGETVHVVRRGDTLSAIAKVHGVNLGDLRARNAIKGDKILVGQRVIIPPRSSSAVGDVGKSATANAAAARPAAIGAPGGGVLGPVRAVTAGLKVTPGRWTHLVVHHSGIEAGNAKSYDAGHRRRGMENGLAYHFVIGNGRDSGDGQIEVGPRWTRQVHGGHVRSEAMNEHGIGICLVGNFERRTPGKKQLASLYSLLDWLRADGLPGDRPPRVTVHRWVDRNHTVCPGRRFPYAELARRYGASAKAT